MSVTVTDGGRCGRSSRPVRRDLPGYYGALKVRPAAGPLHHHHHRGEGAALDPVRDRHRSGLRHLGEPVRGVRPTQLRYRGHQGDRPRVRAPRRRLGIPVACAPGMDASSTSTTASRWRSATYASGDGTRPWMGLWNPWAANSGWYWQHLRCGRQPDEQPRRHLRRRPLAPDRRRLQRAGHLQPPGPGRRHHGRDRLAGRTPALLLPAPRTAPSASPGASYGGTGPTGRTR